MNKQKERPLISFDWAMESILRQKSSFEILEGLFSTLLQEDVRIEAILETDSNKEHSQDKYTRTDIQVRSEKGDIYIVELQYTYEVYYFHRIAFGTAVAIKEYLKEKSKYDTIKRVISITIAYANLGEGVDYVYRGNNYFYGIHHNGELGLDNKQKEKYNIQELKDIFPEYWIIRLKQYNDELHNELDQWIYFLKRSSIKNDFTAKGLQKAAVKLDELKLFEGDEHSYNEYLKYILERNSEIDQKEDDQEQKEKLIKVVQEKEKTIEKKDKAIEEKEKTIEEKEKTIEEKEKTIEENKKAMEEKEKTIEENKKAMEEKEKTIEENKKELEEKDKLIQELMKQIQQKK